MAHFDKNLCCSRCDYKTNKTYNLKRHMVLKHTAGKEIPRAGKEIFTAGKEIFTAGKEIPPAGKEIPDTKSLPLQCYKCNKIFTRVYGLNVHIETCEGKKSNLNCQYCNSVFTVSTNKYRHQNICKERIFNEQKQLIINNIGTQNNIINNITNNNTIHIQLNNFGQENTSYLSKEFLNNCFDCGPKSIKNIMLGIYFDENHPENHTVKLISLKNEYVNVHKDGDWHPKTINDAIDVMKQTSIDALIKTKIDELNDMLIKNKLNDKDNVNINKLQSIQNIPQKIEKEINKSAIINLIAVKNKEEI